MSTGEKVYAMLGNEDLWTTAVNCRRVLEEAKIPFSVCGGVAVCLHGYQRNTADLDLIIQPGDAEEAKRTLEQAGLAWDSDRKEFRTLGGIAVQLLMTGERAGRGSQVKLPEPIGELNVEEIDDLPVLRLSRLIEIKIACGSGDARRTHKDFADVVELIAIRNLDSSFAQYLHKSVRKTFRELVKNARGEA